MNFEETTWKLAGNLISAQLSCAIKSFPMPGPVPMLLLRKPDDQTMCVLQGTPDEQQQRLEEQLTEFAPTAWVRARVEDETADSATLVVELHEGEQTHELRLPYELPFSLVTGAAGFPEGAPLKALRDGFVDGYGHDLLDGPAAPILDDDWVAGRAIVELQLGENISRKGNQLVRVAGTSSIESFDLAQVTVTADERRFVGISIVVLVFAASATGAMWLCGGWLGVGIAALPALFMLFVAIRAAMKRPHLRIEIDGKREWWSVRGASMQEVETFVGELPKTR